MQIDKKASIYQQRTASHIPTQLPTSQKQRRPGHVLGSPQSPQRYPPLHIRLLFRPIRQIFFIQLCPNRARQQRITADPMLPQRRCTALHQRQHPRLRGRVVALLRPADQRADARNPDNASTAGRLACHLFSGRLHGEERAGEICVLVPPPACGRDLEELFEFTDSGVRDECVQPTELLHSLFDELRACFWEHNIAGDGEEGDLRLVGGFCGRIAGFDGGEGIGAE